MRISDWSSDVCSSDLALDMTQPALSYRIKQMEALLGVQLFRRRPRGLELTNEGETLQTAVRQGLERLDEAVQAIRRRAGTPTARLATDFAFAAFRLMPAVAAFRRSNPKVDIHILANQALATIRSHACRDRGCTAWYIPG